MWTQKVGKSSEELDIFEPQVQICLGIGLRMGDKKDKEVEQGPEQTEPKLS
jgi:hypothetical protein